MIDVQQFAVRQDDAVVTGEHQRADYTVRSVSISSRKEANEHDPVSWNHHSHSSLQRPAQADETDACLLRQHPLFLCGIGCHR